MSRTGCGRCAPATPPTAGGGAEVREGVQVGAWLDSQLDDPGIAYAHLHSARHGDYLCHAGRAGADPRTQLRWNIALASSTMPSMWQNTLRWMRRKRRSMRGPWPRVAIATAKWPSTLSASAIFSVSSNAKRLCQRRAVMPGHAQATGVQHHQYPRHHPARAAGDGRLDALPGRRRYLGQGAAEDQHLEEHRTDEHQRGEQVRGEQQRVGNHGVPRVAGPRRHEGGAAAAAA